VRDFGEKLDIPASAPHRSQNGGARMKTFHMWFESQPYPDAVPFTSAEACAAELERQRKAYPSLRKEVIEIVVIAGSWPNYRIVQEVTNVGSSTQG
jgi:hypothetical protein